ncbi:MAG: hypothetical protein WA705_29655 [Candidatus Ozemobacteraceae bacterium]
METRGSYRGFYLPQLLAPTRVDDKSKSLWHVLNVLQEKMIRGGIRGGTNRRSIKAITSVTRDVELNTTLFNIAESLRDMQRDGQLS